MSWLSSSLTTYAALLTWIWRPKSKFGNFFYWSHTMTTWGKALFIHHLMTTMATPFLKPLEDLGSLVTYSPLSTFEIHSVREVSWNYNRMEKLRQRCHSHRKLWWNFDPCWTDDGKLLTGRLTLYPVCLTLDLHSGNVSERTCTIKK